MEPNAAKKTLLGSLLLSGILIVIASAREGTAPKPRQFIGLGAAGFIAALLVETVPPLGAAFALLIAVSMLLRHGEKAAEGILGAQNYSSTNPRASVVPGGTMPNVSRGADTSGGWSGAKKAVQRATAPGKAKGLRVSSSKRITQKTSSGGISDHWTGCRACYAEDLVGTVAQMDAGMAAIAAGLGVPYRKGTKLEATVERDGFRIQLLYRTMTGGNHFTHGHVGARLSTYNPGTEGRPT